MDLSLPNPVRPIFGTPLRDDTVVVNIGPSHPATHGTVQIIAELDGERVLRTDVHCGYLHRGFEKECEDHTWHNLIPYVDRLNYVSALVNDFAYCGGVGTISTADALSFGCTGPILRSTGLARDLRKDAPYLAYAELDFDVPAMP